MKYDHKSIEQKWQKRWADSHAFEAKTCPAELQRSGREGEKFYALVEFPYPSGEGLHVGHLRPYIGMDVIARKRRMEGKNVLFPIGWDAFGLPAENYALKTGQHPAVATAKNAANYKRQIQSVGVSFDWSREVNTTDPAYYKWTQWIFLQLLKHGLAYKAKMPINWCPACKIGLANEEAVGGACERCGGLVEKRDREQWMLKITAYAEKLLAGLETVDYIERAKIQQINWIGKSEGATIKFQISNFKFQIPVFTTRPDTLFGATYLVLAPEHPLIEQLLSSSSSRAEQSEVEGSPIDQDFSASLTAGRSGRAEVVLENPDEVRAYITATRHKTDIERTSEEKESAKGGSASGGKTGVELKGISAVNPANGEDTPVWIADYVLAHYGTGAIMAVPAHDDRDFAFAKKFDLPIVPVIARSPCAVPIRSFTRRRDAAISGAVGVSNTECLTPRDQDEVYTGVGSLMNSGKFTGMTSEDAKRAITESVGGKMTTTYKLRDWVFSRQRYWGEPIPVVFCATCGTVPIPEDQLPLILPEVEKYQPTDTGDSPLAAITDWVNTKCPQCGGHAKRETDVMPNWAGSSWYYLAYAMRGNSKSETRNPNIDWDEEMLAYWMPVDWYNGGMEHVTLHLLYSRFWNIFLHDIGVVPVAEPYKKRTSHGLILASDGEKMSKSRGNVVNPDEIVEKFGADAVRVYEMFIGPFDQAVPWSTDGLIGVRRFLEKVCAIGEHILPTCHSERSEESYTIGLTLLRHLHQTIKKVTEDIESMHFNTAVSTLMILTNELVKQENLAPEAYRTLLILLSPFAPHLTEELYSFVIPSEVEGSRPMASIITQPWPSYDPALLVEDEIALVIQVNGKLRATIRVPADITESDARSHALAEPNVAKHIEGKEVRKLIFVPGKLINIVV